MRFSRRHLWMMTLPFLAGACQGDREQSPVDETMRISTAVDSMEAELSEGLQAIDRKVAELHTEADRAAESAEAELAAQYREAADGLERQKNTLQDQWNALTGQMSDRWEDVKDQLDDFKEGMTEVLDSLDRNIEGANEAG